MTRTKPKNPHRITVEKALMASLGMTYTEYLVSNEAHDSVVPARCDEGCEGEPDGRCEHGCPSVMLALGAI